MTTYDSEPPSYDEIPVPDRSQELDDLALDWLQTNVLKLIVTRLVPLIVGSATVALLLAWLQDTIGLDVDPAVVTGFVVTVVGGIVAVVFSYVRNHGNGAAAVGTALIEMEKMKVANDALLPPLDDDAAGGALR